MAVVNRHTREWRSDFYFPQSSFLKMAEDLSPRPPPPIWAQLAQIPRVTDPRGFYHCALHRGSVSDGQLQSWPFLLQGRAIVITISICLPHCGSQWSSVILVKVSTVRRVFSLLVRARVAPIVFWKEFSQWESQVTMPQSSMFIVSVEFDASVRSIGYITESDVKLVLHYHYKPPFLTVL